MKSLAWFIALVGCLLTGCDRSNPDGGAMLERGVAYLERGDNEKAIAALSESLRVRPNDADAHYNRGLAHVRMGNFDAARADYTESIKLRPEFSEAYTNRAVTFVRRGQLDEAIKDCTAAIRLKPDSELAFRNRGLAYHDQGKYAEALADFNEALRLDGGLAEAYFNRANTYLKLGHNAEAAADFAEAYRLDPSLNVPAEYRTKSAGAAEVASTGAALPAPTPDQPLSAPAPVAESSDERALEAAADVYKKEGFSVEPATLPETCELICVRPQERVRLEVKVVTQESEPIRLTADEVNGARDESTRTDLIVVLVNPDSADTEQSPIPRIISRLVDWTPGTEELKPIEFEYDVKAIDQR